MGHDNHEHHVDDLSGFSLIRVIWPAALLIMLIFVTRNCCGGSECCAGGSCEKPGAKKEMHNEHHEAPAEGAHH